MLVIGIGKKILTSHAGHTRVSDSFDPEDATALRGGGSRWLLLLSRRQLAANVRARNIAQEAWPDLYSSSKREPPRGKPVASKEGSQTSLVCVTSQSLTGQW